MSQKLYCEKTKAVLASASAITELVIDKNDGLVSHIDVFLYDTSMSKNGSMLTEEIGDISAKSYIDLPLIMTDSLGHNVFPEDPSIMPDGGVFVLTKPISEYIKASRRFEVGRVVNTVKKMIATASGKIPTWMASVKLTNQEFRKFITRLSKKYADIRQAKLFVSSFHVGTAVANSQGKYVYDGPVTGMHIAIVKSPAYPDDKALISGICIGNDSTCMNNLAAAASYDAEYDKPLIDFNNELLQFTRTLYPSASANKNSMSDDNKNQNPEPKDNTEESQEPKGDNKEAQTVQIKKEEFEELKRKVAELSQNNPKNKKSKSEDKPEDDEDAEDDKKENENVKKLEARIKQLEREKSIAKWLEKLKPIKGINALQQASLIVDKGFTDDEAESYVKSFTPLLKASANSNNGTTPGQQKQRGDDALLTKFELASASSYESYDDAIKKESNKAVNLGAAQFYSQFLKK